MRKAFDNALRKSFLVFTTLSALVLLAGIAHGQDWEHRDSLKAELVSFSQVPSVLAKSHGNFEAEVNQDGTLSFSMSYADMSSPVAQAHIHFGASKTNGGIIVYLCGVQKPACPASGTVTGTITASDISVLPASNGDSVIPQGIQPGDFTGLVKAIRNGDAYVNVHTETFPSGEIRGQVHLQ
jgi:CHRD domain